MNLDANAIGEWCGATSFENIKIRDRWCSVSVVIGKLRALSSSWTESVSLKDLSSSGLI